MPRGVKSAGKKVLFMLVDRIYIINVVLQKKAAGSGGRKKSSLKIFINFFCLKMTSLTVDRAGGGLNKKMFFVIFVIDNEMILIALERNVESSTMKTKMMKVNFQFSFFKKPFEYFFLFLMIER